MRHLSALNILIALVLLALISYMLALKANAHSIPCGGLVEPTCASVRHYHKPRYRKPVRHKKRRKPQVRAYQRRSDEDDVKCRPMISVVGSQFVTPAGATSSAEKAFMERARYTWGESYMDVDNAKDYAIRCSRSSVGDVGIKGIAEAVFYRCELKARPCRAPFESREK